MIHAYVKYPQPHLTIHHESSCSMIRMHNRSGKRYRRVDSDNLGQFLTELVRREIPFAAQPGLNDIWLEIALDTTEQELALVHIFQPLIGVIIRR